MYDLKFTDGTILRVAENSTIDDIMIVVSTYGAVDELSAHFVKENMTRMELNGKTSLNRIPTGCTVSGDGQLVARFTTRGLTQEEIIENQAQQILELQEAVAELMSDGEDEDPTVEQSFAPESGDNVDPVDDTNANSGDTMVDGEELIDG